MAAPLCGTYNQGIDAKGRMLIPSKLREILGAEFYLCIGHDDRYIAVYSLEEFEVYKDKLYTIPGKKGSDVRRKLLAYADRQTPDKQGRIFVGQKLREHAGIEGEVVIIGAANRAEIWDKATWEGFDSSISLDDINDALSEIVV